MYLNPLNLKIPNIGLSRSATWRQIVLIVPFGNSEILYSIESVSSRKQNFEYEIN